MHGMLVALSLWFGSPSLGAEPVDLDWILERRVSPGSVALLAEHATDPRARERLVGALGHPRPEVRAAAARVIYASGLTTLASDLELALARETSPVAAEELARAVAASGGVRKAELLLDTGERLAMVQTIGLIMAGVYQQAALAFLERLRALDESFPLDDFVRLSIRSRPGVLRPLASGALREADVSLWSTALQVVRGEGHPIDARALAAATTSSNRAIRLATWWHLTELEASGESLPAPVEKAVTAALASRSSVESEDESNLLELVARARGEERSRRLSWDVLLAADGLLNPDALDDGRFLRLYTKEERRELSFRIGEDEKALDEVLERYASRPDFSEGRGRSPSRTGPTMRTVGGFPAGFVSDLLDVTGCEPDSDLEYGLADVRYSTDGRPLSASISSHPIEASGCSEASRALLLSRIVPVHELSMEGAWDRLVVLLTPEFLDCLQHQDTAPELSGDVRPPEKKKNVPPEYPLGAKADRLEGMVILEAVIGASGCVRDVSVLRSPDGRLELAAVLAVGQWRYDPARVAGEPVPIRMMVTVNFSLD